MFLFITWNPSPVLDLGFVQLRWYALLFVSGLWIAYGITYKLFKIRQIPAERLQSLWLLAVVGAVVGARLGEVLFYNPQFYFSNPAEILKIWNGGLASHGATLVLIGLFYYYATQVLQKPFFWLGDSLVSGIAATAACVRLGNFINGEIVGRASQLPWSMVFPEYDEQPRHPVQLYEALTYILLSAALYVLFPKWQDKTGKLSGLFFAGMFGTRFLLEFFKQNNSTLTEGFPLTMGQLLSLPLAVLGLWLLAKAAKGLPFTRKK